jgi:hypothetical protein
MLNAISKAKKPKNRRRRPTRREWPLVRDGYRLRVAPGLLPAITVAVPSTTAIHKRAVF